MAGKKSVRPKTSAKTDSKKTKTVDICSNHHISKNECHVFQKELLSWYDREQRTLPWRDIAKNEKDPNIRGYAVWVSEVMLQQTQVATVIPYFNKWMEKWPTVKSLAGAKIEDVLQVWAGLGYYSRGRRLHEGAQIIMDKLDGEIPDTVTDLVKLIPGIGAYSAGAIASVAFQKRTGVVDGNVIRVLSRFRVIGANVTQTGVREHLWDLANELVPADRPGDFNQALMELGAIVCTPQNPSCGTCPLNKSCLAYSKVKANQKEGNLETFLKCKSKPCSINENDCVDIENVVDCKFCLPESLWKANPQVTAFPCKVEKKKPREEKVNVFVIGKDKNFVMVRRPEKGLLAGLWEFPSSVSYENDSSNSTSFDDIMEKLGIASSLQSSRTLVGEVVHLFSHIHTTYVVEHLILKKSSKVKTTVDKVMWMSEEEIKNAAVSTAVKKILALIKKAEKGPLKQNPAKKRKTSSEDTKQTSIKSFFS